MFSNIVEFKEELSKREIQFNEEINGLGKLTCCSIYTWYDGPLSYVSYAEDNDKIYFFHAFDWNEKEAVYLAFIISEEDHMNMELEKETFYSLIKNKTAYKVIFSDTETNIEDLNIEDLNKEGLPLEDFNFKLENLND